MPGRVSANRFDPTSLDLTDLDVVALARTTAAATGSIVTRAADLAKEATYVGIGFGVLGWQRAQVRRREIERALRR